MEVKLKERKVALENLPGKDDEYWEHSDIRLHELKDTKPCKHFFVHRTGQEVVCSNCGAGYFLSKGWYVDKGTLYTPDDEPVA